MSNATGVCSVEGCEGIIYSRNWCQTHYNKWYKHGNPLAVTNWNRYSSPICSVEGCGKLRMMTEYCMTHYHRVKQFGRTNTIKRKDGEGTITEHGYKLITVAGNRLYEHVYLAEKALGKKLPSEALVHHMNGNKLDNHTQFNLVICPNQAYHMLLHKRAKELKLDLRLWP